MDIGVATVLGSSIVAIGAVAAAALRRSPPPEAGQKAVRRALLRERARGLLLHWGWLLPWGYCTWLAFVIEDELEFAVAHFRELELASATMAQVQAAEAQHALTIAPRIIDQTIIAVFFLVWLWIVYKHKRSSAANE